MADTGNNYSYLDSNFLPHGIVREVRNDIILALIQNNRKMCSGYWNYNKPPKTCGNEGWVLDRARSVSWFFAHFVATNVIAYCKERKHAGDRRKYKAIDWFIVSKFLIALIAFILVGCFPQLVTNSVSKIVLMIFVAYFLFCTLQVWIDHFILGELHPRSAYRTLVLVFIAYGEMILWYAILTLIFWNNFELSGTHQNINGLRQAFYYALSNASVGSNYLPVCTAGYIIFGTQILYALLFVTAVVNRVISLSKEK